MANGHKHVVRWTMTSCNVKFHGLAGSPPRAAHGLPRPPGQVTRWRPVLGDDDGRQEGSALAGQAGMRQGRQARLRAGQIIE